MKHFSFLAYGISTIEHCIILAGFSANCKLGVDFNVETGFKHHNQLQKTYFSLTDSSKLHKFLENGENMLRQAQTSPCQVPHKNLLQIFFINFFEGFFDTKKANSSRW